MVLIRCRWYWLTTAGQRQPSACISTGVPPRCMLKPRPRSLEASGGVPRPTSLSLELTSRSSARQRRPAVPSFHLPHSAADAAAGTPARRCTCAPLRLLPPTALLPPPTLPPPPALTALTVAVALRAEAQRAAGGTVTSRRLWIAPSPRHCLHFPKHRTRRRGKGALQTQRAGLHLLRCEAPLGLQLPLYVRLDPCVCTDAHQKAGGKTLAG